MQQVEERERKRSIYPSRLIKWHNKKEEKQTHKITAS